jgi:hypothetical protein
MTMNAQSRIRYSLTATSVLLLVHATTAWAGVQPQPFRTGLFGVTTGQSIRISVVNAGGASGIINPCFHVVDADGKLLLEHDSGLLSSGAGTFVDFDAPAAGAGVRTQLRAEVELVPMANPPDPVAWLVALRREVLLTLEVFDTATGETVITLPFAAVAGVEPTPFAEVAGVQPEPFAEVAGINPQPFRTGLFGVTTGQSIRVSVANAGEVGGLIEPRVRVFNLAGALLAEVDSDSLPAGGGRFVDLVLPPGGAVVRQQVRVEVELVPTVQPADGAVPAIRRQDIHLTLEVFDTATGQMQFTMPYAAVGFNPQPEPPEPVGMP